MIHVIAIYFEAKHIFACINFRDISIMQLVLAITLALVASANARSGGAPDDACSSQVPGHGSAASTDASPYTVTFEGDATYTYDHPKKCECTLP